MFRSRGVASRLLLTLRLLLIRLNPTIAFGDSFSVHIGHAARTRLAIGIFDRRIDFGPIGLGNARAMPGIDRRIGELAGRWVLRRVGVLVLKEDRGRGFDGNIRGLPLSFGDRRDVAKLIRFRLRVGIVKMIRQPFRERTDRYVNVGISDPDQADPGFAGHMGCGPISQTDRIQIVPNPAERFFDRRWVHARRCGARDRPFDIAKLMIPDRAGDGMTVFAVVRKPDRRRFGLDVMVEAGRVVELLHL